MVLVLSCQELREFGQSFSVISGFLNDLLAFQCLGFEWTPSDLYALNDFGPSDLLNSQRF